MGRDDVEQRDRPAVVGRTAGRDLRVERGRATEQLVLVPAAGLEREQRLVADAAVERLTSDDDWFAWRDQQCD